MELINKDTPQVFLRPLDSMLNSIETIVNRMWLIKFIPQTCHYFLYAVNAHSVDGSTIAAGRHITLIGIFTLIGYEEHFLIKQNSVEPFISVIRIFTMFA